MYLKTRKGKQCHLNKYKKAFDKIQHPYSNNNNKNSLKKFGTNRNFFNLKNLQLTSYLMKKN